MALMPNLKRVTGRGHLHNTIMSDREAVHLLLLPAQAVARQCGH
jgi:hypothetical protein